MYISYLSVNGPFVPALQKCFRIKFEVSKNGDKTKGWRERDDGGDTEGRKHHWLAPPGVKLGADSSDNERHSASEEQEWPQQRGFSPEFKFNCMR